MVASQNISTEHVWQLLENISDPEIPVISIIDLGIVRDIQQKESGVEIFITPTYSGCPAMDVIATDIRMNLLANGFKNIQITQQLSPAWTTDWMTEKGKEKLMQYGISPPQIQAGKASYDRINKMLFAEEAIIECPQCHLKNTTLLSQFGSTSCKALYQCNDCKEPFDYFKCH